MRKAAFFAADSLSVSDKLGVTFANLTSRELPLQANLCVYDCAVVLAEWVATLQDRVGSYLGILGSSTIDLTQVPAIMLLEEEDVKLMDKIGEIIRGAEIKMNLDLAKPGGGNGTGSGSDGRLQTDDSGGYAAKLLRVTAYMFDKATVWPGEYSPDLVPRQSADEVPSDPAHCRLPRDPCEPHACSRGEVCHEPWAVRVKHFLESEEDISSRLAVQFTDSITGDISSSFCGRCTRYPFQHHSFLLGSQPLATVSSNTSVVFSPLQHELPTPANHHTLWFLAWTDDQHWSSLGNTILRLSLLFSDFCWLYSHRPFVGASAPISRVAFFTLIRLLGGFGTPKREKEDFMGHAGKSRWLISGEWFLMLCVFFLRDHKGFMGDEMTRRYDAVLLSGLFFVMAQGNGMGSCEGICMDVWAKPNGCVHEQGMPL